MSKVNRCVLIALLLVMVHFLLFLYSLLYLNNNSPVVSDDTSEAVPVEEQEQYVIKDKQLELGDLSVFEVTVDGEPYMLIRAKGKEDELVPRDEYFGADIGDTIE